MKKVFLLLALALIGVLAWYLLVTRKKPENEVPKQQPLAVSQHSDSFNVAMNNVLASYYALSNAFVNWDTAAVSTHSDALAKTLAAVNFDEIKKDSVIFQTAETFISTSKGEAETIAQGGDITAQRRSFNNLSDNLYNLLRTVRYDRAKIYLQECPMAFNDDEAAIWLSGTDSIKNPYLGLHHPRYKSGMLECGSTKDTMNFTGL